MKALELFSKYAANKTFIAVILGSLSGLFFALLIPIVMIALAKENNQSQQSTLVEFFGLEIAHSQFALLFLCLCLLILVFNALSEIILSRVALDIRFRLRKKLYRQIANAPISSLENVGQSRLIQALSTDVSIIVMGAQQFPTILTNAVTLFGMFGYLAYIDFRVFTYVVQVVLFGVISYQLPVLLGTRYFASAREHQDTLQEGFRGLIGGAKELKLSSHKQQNYENEVLFKEEKTIRDLEKKGLTAYNLAGSYGSLLCFFAIGGLSFIFINYHVISNSQIIAAVMVLLYITGPIGFLLNVVPQLARTKVSLKKIDKLYEDLPAEIINQQNSIPTTWKSLHLRGVEYQYSHLASNAGNKSDNVAPIKKRPRFKVGPVDLAINRGEVTFIAGGNGSGKSTLSKIVSQHYLPSEGLLSVDDIELNETNLESFRQQIACIYSDYYLFERILDVANPNSDYQDKIEHYLTVFGLSEKVEFSDGCFSTLKLSDGQRRRLALVVAIVEDKQLYVFDEWAADQDPEFKDVFYREILPMLKEQGKAVVVISHDDRYFDVADQLFVMEQGELVTSEENFYRKTYQKSKVTQ